MNSKNAVAQAIKTCSLIFFFFGLLLSLFILIEDVFNGIFLFIIALVNTIFIYAFGEIVQLLNDIKINTRNDVLLSCDKSNSPSVSSDNSKSFFEVQRIVESSKTLADKDNLFSIATSGIETSRKEANKELYKTSLDMLNALAKDGYVPAISFLRKLDKMQNRI